MEKTTKFARGIYFERNPKSPDFVIGKLSVKVPEAIAFLQAEANAAGYVNMDIKIAKSGKPYIAVSEWVPTQKKESANEGIEFPEEEINPEDIPF